MEILPLAEREKFPQWWLDELRVGAPIIDVAFLLGIELKQKGEQGEYVGFSPFSNEKTPSFTVSPRKGFFHCFSTGEFGDVIVLVQKVRGVPFGTAVRILSQQYNVPFYKEGESRESFLKRYGAIQRRKNKKRQL